MVVEIGWLKLDLLFCDDGGESVVLCVVVGGCLVILFGLIFIECLSVVLYLYV